MRLLSIGHSVTGLIHFFAAVGATTPDNTPPGLAYVRTTSQALAIVYANSATGTTELGFFPAGLNGNIATV